MRRTLQLRWKVRELAEQRKLKVSQLAELAKINKNTATSIWHGRARRIEARTLEHICLALECDLGDILELVEVFEPEDDAESTDAA
jgi:putative transcriptional regulator